MNPVVADAGVKRALVAALSNDQMHELLHTRTSEDEAANYSNDGDIMMTIARRKLENLVAQESDRKYA